MSVGLIYHEDYGSLHVPFFPKPWMEGFECPERASLTMRRLEEVGLLSEVERFTPHQASKGDLLKVHSPYLYDVVKELSKFERGEVGSSSLTSKDTFKLACLAAGGAVKAVEVVAEGKCRQSIALVRPPGHHAGWGCASGLCFFNNVAVAVRRLQDMDVRRVLILDVDSHPGDGTAQIFYSDPDVFVLSFHEYDLEVAGRGWIGEEGSGNGRGATLNVPLPPGTNGRTYIWAFERVFFNVADFFKPEFIVVSLGLDAHYADPVGNMRLQALDYNEIAGQIVSVAEEYCKGRVAFILEGGYNLLALPLSVAAVLSRLTERRVEYYDRIEVEGKPPSSVKQLVNMLLDRFP
ncbi:MAG: histone deacetylase family protein [Candidatus Freyarchaeota archaeon]